MPPLRTRGDPWKYHREIYKRRYEIERQLRRLKGFRRVSSRIEHPDALFLGFILFVFTLIFNTLILPSDSIKDALNKSGGIVAY